MQRPAFDPGLTREFGAPLSRAVNKDGSFNVRRSGVSWRAFHPWLYVVNMSWTGFIALVIFLYSAINTCFALCYYLLRPTDVMGSGAPTELGRFLNDFFFSAQTLTTVGFGSLSPRGVPAQFLSAIEALTGLMAFAIITGLLVARASRPSARISYSANALIAPYQDRTGLMFRIANERSNNLLELQARVMLMTVTNTAGGKPERKFELLTLERDTVLFFPLTWTVVHPIDESSPLFGKSKEDLTGLQAEIMILIKGFDETFSQTVQSRYSYTFDEIEWGAKFLPAFRVHSTGDIVLELDKLGDFATHNKLTP